MVVVKDDIVTERSRIMDEVSRLVDSRLQQLMPPGDSTEIQRLLDIERERTVCLESQVELLLNRIAALEDRPNFGALNPALLSTPGAGSSKDGGAIGLDPSELLRSSLHDETPPAQPGPSRKRVASIEAESSRAPKRFKQKLLSHNTPAALLEDAVTEPVTESLMSAAPMPTVAEPTPRTPPVTRNARRPLHPPASPRGAAPTSLLRKFPGGPGSPTTDSPRKGKGKGKEIAANLLPLPSPSKPKMTKERVVSSSIKDVPTTPKPTSSRDKESDQGLHNLQSTTTFLERIDSSARNPGDTSPAFPVYEPPSRFSRGLGLGLPSNIPSSSVGVEGHDMPTGLLPPFGYGTPRQPSGGSSSIETESPGMAVEMIGEISTPRIGDDPWAVAADDAPPPSPGKGTLYGTELDPDNVDDAFQSTRRSTRNRKLTEQEEWV